ncbi:hypothetical protein MCA0721 [Methylococcus capsulatus str. Bath]|uniref:Uncharacterized protein n=1 Tax=Methylococcus capsulatus (strain ATCC 33009 / NCIMB 11132 / Bath) TaxID=243233 RepID=Q60AW6_METCA|nr:hypothetical protein MCA0721 [Methylococcus capsulatus str. Bath]
MTLLAPVCSDRWISLVDKNPPGHIAHGRPGASSGARLAEAVRFELTNGFPLPVFKTGAFNHSATLP